MCTNFDRTYINQIAHKLDLFRWLREGVAEFRCPLCGDSQKNARKRRGYFYQDNSQNCFRFKCHNCAEAGGWSLKFWLQKYEPEVFKEYLMEEFEQSNRPSSGRNRKLNVTGTRKKETRTASVTRAPVDRKADNPWLDAHSSLDSLPDGHHAKDYMVGRCLPSARMNLLYYTDNFKESATSFGPQLSETLQRLPEDKRILIPFFSNNGVLVAMQGRALDPKCDMRYITIKKHEDTPKTYGLERVDPKKTVLVCEGPLDSLFLPNCLASADADLLKVEGDIYIPDSQYRNRQIVVRIEDMIKKGKKVVLFPANYPWKDVNDMVMKGGMTPREVMQFIAGHVYSGLDAQLKFASLRRI